jgi:hypothetical protein
MVVRSRSVVLVAAGLAGACGDGSDAPQDGGEAGGAVTDGGVVDGWKADGRGDAGGEASETIEADARSGDEARLDAPGEASISASLPARYPAGAIHSPITPTVVAAIRAIVASGQRDPKKFFRLGDANCGTETMPFEQPNPLTLPLLGLPDAGALQTTIDYFASTKIAAADPNGGWCQPGSCSSWSWCGVFCNDSTIVATSAFEMNQGQTLLAQELAANDGAFALVAFGGAEQDDLAPRTGPGSENVDVNGYGGMGYAQGIWELTDELIAQGVVPILRTFSTRWFPTSDPMCQAEPSGGYSATTPFTAAGTGPLMETIEREIAEARQVPFASFGARAAQVGATPPDAVQACGIHYTQGAQGPGDFTDMTTGFSIDNLNDVEQLDRVRQVVQGTWLAEANPGPARTGSGSAADPFVVDSLPFADLRNLSAAATSPISDYSTCAPSGASVPTIDGPALFYRLDVSSPAGLRVRLSLTAHYKSPIDMSTPAILRHFTSAVDVAKCDYQLDENKQLLNNYYRMVLPSGTHYFTIASPKFAPTSTPAEVLFAIQPCAADDPYCP